MHSINFHKRIKSLRQAGRLTQDDLAKELEKRGCGATGKYAISKYENNKRLPDVKSLVVISEFFNVSVDYMLGLEEKKR